MNKLKNKLRKLNYKILFAFASIAVAVVLVTTLVIAPPTWAPRFKAANKDSNYIYAAENKIFNVEIGIKEHNKPVVEFGTSENTNVKFTLLDSAEKVAKPIKKGNKIVFEEVMSGVDLSYETLENGIKEEIVLKQTPNSNEFIFGMELESAEADGVMTNFPNPVFYDKDGNYLFHFASPFAFDASGNRTDEVIMQIKKSPIERNYQIRLLVNEQWLYSSDRVYPITIDPTVLHDTTTEFAKGQFNRTKDTANSQLETYYQPLTADENTLALYHMDANNNCGASDTYLCDSSGNNRTGTIAGSTSKTTSLLGTGVNTGNTTADYIDLPTVDINNEWTAELWFKMPLTSTGASWHTLLKGDTNDHQIIVQRSDMMLGMYDNAGATAFRSTGFAINSLQNGWHHMAVVGMNGKQDFYINGDYVGQTDKQSTADIGVLGNVVSGSQNWGEFDEVRISNIARSVEEIKAAAARRPYGEYTSPIIDLGEKVMEWTDLSWTENGVKTGTGETPFSSTNLLAQWNFNETSGTTANNDAEGTSCAGSPVNCDGTLAGFDSTTSQDSSVGSTWTANQRWGAGALEFDGINSEVVCTDANCGGTSRLDIGNRNWSVEAWVRTTNKARQYIVGKGSVSTQFSYSLETGLDNTGQVDFFLFNTVDTAYMRANGATSISDGQWHHLVGTYDGTTINLYVDGKLDGSSTTKTGTLVADSTSNFSIGSRAGTSLFFNGTIDNVRVFDRALTASETISNYNVANVQFQTRTGPDSSPENGDWSDWTPLDSTTTIENFDDIYMYNVLDGDLVAYFPMDETGNNSCSGGQDTCDVKGGYHGTNTGTYIVGGVFNNGRGLDGTSDYIYTATTLPIPTGDFTYEAWIKPDTVNDEMLFMASDGTGANEFYVHLSATNKISVATNGAVRATSATIITNEWQHVAVTREGSTITTYINGVADSVTGTDGVAMNFGACGLLIGTDADAGCNGTLGNWFDGRIDEVKIYNSALAASDIKDHFIMGATNPDMVHSLTNTDVVNLGDTNRKILLGNQQRDNSAKLLLRLDDTNGDNAGLDAYDSSPSNLNGEFNGSNIASAVVDGKAGKARNFNGTNDYIDFGDAAALKITGSQTISMWLYPTDFTLRRNPYAKAFGGEGTITQELNQTLNYYYGTAGANTTPYQAFNSSGTLTANQWNHIAIVRDLNGMMLYWYINGVQTNSVAATYSAAVASTLNAYVGTGYTNPYAGKIDEVGIYNAALSAREVEELYSMGQGNYINQTIGTNDISNKDRIELNIAADRPGTYLEATLGESTFDNYQPDAFTKGLWHMEDVGGTLQDSSGNSEHASLVGGAVQFSQVGPKGRSLNLDGASYYNLGDKFDFGAGSFTYDFWIKPTLSANSIILSSGSFNVDGIYMHLQADGSIHFYTNQAGASQTTTAGVGTVKANVWQHIAVVRSGSNVSIYVNGENKTQSAGSHITPTTPTNNMHLGTYIGAPASYYVTGLVDELRISNTARSAEDIRKTFEMSKRTHPITIDFAASLGNPFDSNTEYLISNSSDTSFRVNALTYGLPKLGSNLSIDDKIIIKEKIDETEYLAQGTVESVNEDTGEVVVTSWDNGSTFPASGYTSFANVFKWQKEHFDLSAISLNAHINSIDELTFRVTNNTEGRTVYLDDVKTATDNYLTTSGGSTVTSDAGFRYVQYKALFNSSDTDVSANVTNVSLDYVTSSPGAYWKLDENYETTAYDHSPNALNGTITNATWTESGRCISRTCLTFDGTDDTVYMTDVDTLDFDFSASDEFTIGGWFRTVNDTSEQTLISKKSASGTGSAGYMFYTTAAGEVKFNMSDGSATELTLTSRTGLNGNDWHYVVAVADSTNVTLYVDGVQAATTANTLSSANISNATNFKLGENGGGTTDFDGLIDEVRVYRYARSVSEIKADYNAIGSSVKGASASFGPDDSFLSSDLVGYWKMDHTSGNAPDSSENGFTATETGTGIVEGAAGRYDFAADFDGSTNTYYTMGDQPEFELQEFTAAAWVKKEGQCGPFHNCSILYSGMSGNTGWGLRLLGSTPYAQISIRDNLQFATGTTPIIDNVWYHVAATVDGQKLRIYVNGKLETETNQTIFPTYGTNPLTIGNGNTNKDLPMNGKIDEARYYNRAFSEKEIERLYRLSIGPVGYWNMDENTGTTTIYDKSGNNSNGSLTGIEEVDWVAGKYGSALQLDGTSGEYVTVTDANTLDVKNITLSAWVKRNADSGTYERVISKDNNFSDYLYYLQISNTDTVQGGFNDAANATVNNHVATGVTPIPVGTWNHISMTYDGTTLRVYLNGILDGTSSYTGSIPASTTNLHLGRLIADGVYYYSFNGAIDEAKVYNYTRSSEEIIKDINADHPLGGSPVASQLGYWGLDDQNGQTAGDRGFATNNGTLGASSAAGTDDPVWKSNSECKINGCLYFDGSNDHVTLGTDTSLQITGDLTVSSWIKAPSGASANYRAIVSKENNAGTGNTYRMYLITGSGIPRFDCSGGTVANCAINGTRALNDNQWHHLSVTRDDTNKILRMYIDGVLDATATYTGAITGSTEAVYIGKSPYSGGTYPFLGYIDETKIYNVALTESELKIDMNSGSNSAMGGVLGATEKSYIGIGDTAPIGHWALDENTGTATTYDKSENAKNGSLTSITESSWVPGKYGSALYLDGAADIVTIADAADLYDIDGDITYGGWFKSRDTVSNEALISRGATSDWQYILSKNGTTEALTCKIYQTNAGGDYLLATGTTNVTDGEWHHALCVVSGNTLALYLDGKLEAFDNTITGTRDIASTGELYFGHFNWTSGNLYYTGELDEMKIFNYALSTNQVAYEYNRGKPISWWKLDECTGNTANDSSGNGLTGTLSIGATGTNTSAGSCTGSTGEAWEDGENGRYNGSLDFDGTDDQVSMGSSTNTIEGLTEASVCAWIKYAPSSVTTDGAIASRYDGSLAGWLMWVDDEAANSGRTDTISMMFAPETAGGRVEGSTGLVEQNTWAHYCGVFKGGNYIRLYKDGYLDQENTSSIVATVDTTSNTIYLGRVDNVTPRWFEGLIDDVRTYTYALSENQIKNILNEGSAVRFGE